MKIGIGNDHHGLELKNKIIHYLEKNKIEYIDYGSYDNEMVDFVDYAVKVCDSVNQKNVNFGILICGTGIGMSIAANKIKGIICARVVNSEEAKLAREHNMANVLALAENTENIEEILLNFLNTQPSEVERYTRRTNKILNLN
ncbi:MAG: RpiB/LacA/LacB family sugar-phosphate isomerase [Tenericutes bacterium]|nr:RpiB/LacA/LacB family sugar-phosphate isomerase [Mycoplasmatota bacterium]